MPGLFLYVTLRQAQDDRKKHIVAKVEQLQQQLNQLESQIQQSREYAEQLLQAVLKEAFEEKETVYEENEMVTMAAEE